MFSKYFYAATLMAAALAASTAQAKTFQFEVKNLQSSTASFHNGGRYPGLDLSGAHSATLIVDQDKPAGSFKIKSLEIHFPHAPKLLATHFSPTEFGYNALVDDVWVYRQLNVGVSDPAREDPEQSIYFEGHVGEHATFINNPESADGQPVFFASGNLVDVTPSRVVDIQDVNLNGQNLNLSLRNGLKSTLSSWLESQIVINTVWLGHGEEDLHIPMDERPDQGFLKPFRMDIESRVSPDGDYHVITVLSKDEEGNIVESFEERLDVLLAAAYPSFPQP